MRRREGVFELLRVSEGQPSHEHRQVQVANDSEYEKIEGF